MRFLSPGGGGTLACWLSPFDSHSQLSHQQHKPHFGSLVGQLAACTAQPRECSKRQQRRGARAPLRQHQRLQRITIDPQRMRSRGSGGPSSPLMLSSTSCPSSTASKPASSTPCDSSTACPSSTSCLHQAESSSARIRERTSPPSGSDSRSIEKQR